MQLKSQKIKIGSRELPIKCDCLVLAELQKENGSLTALENKLLGYRIVTDEDGYPIRNDDGKYKREKVEPDIGTILRLLVLCINNGLEIEGKEPIDEKELMRAVRNPFVLVLPLFEELRRALDTGDTEEKKQSPSRSGKK